MLWNSDRLTPSWLVPSTTTAWTLAGIGRRASAWRGGKSRVGNVGFTILAKPELRGMKTIGSGVDVSMRQGEARLDQKAGMRTVSQFVTFEKELRARKRRANTPLSIANDSGHADSAAERADRQRLPYRIWTRELIGMRQVMALILVDWTRTSRCVGRSRTPMIDCLCVTMIWASISMFKRPSGRSFTAALVAHLAGTSRPQFVTEANVRASYVASQQVTAVASWYHKRGDERGELIICVCSAMIVCRYAGDLIDWGIDDEETKTQRGTQGSPAVRPRDPNPTRQTSTIGSRCKSTDP